MSNAYNEWLLNSYLVWVVRLIAVGTEPCAFSHLLSDGLQVHPIPDLKAGSAEASIGRPTLGALRLPCSQEQPGINITLSTEAKVYWDLQLLTFGQLGLVQAVAFCGLSCLWHVENTITRCSSKIMILLSKDRAESDAIEQIFHDKISAPMH